MAKMTNRRQAKERSPFVVTFKMKSRTLFIPRIKVPSMHMLDARKGCQELGGDIAEDLSWEEMNAITAIECLKFGRYGYHYWLGAQLHGHEDFHGSVIQKDWDWDWINGGVLRGDDERWYPGESGRRGPGRCMTLGYDKKLGTSYFDNSECVKAHYAICHCHDESCLLRDTRAECEHLWR